MSHFRQLQKGDHISVNGLSSVGCCLSSSSFYYHEGIYSDGYVYHFSGDTQQDAKVKKSTIKEFLRGRNVLYRSNYNGQSCYDSQRVVERAEEIFQNGTWAGYQPIFNNCEHFATYCKTGNAYSNQVKFIFNITHSFIAVACAVLIVMLCVLCTFAIGSGIVEKFLRSLHTRMNWVETF